MTKGTKIFYGLSMALVTFIVYQVTASGFELPAGQVAAITGLSAVQTLATVKILLGIQ